MAILDTFQLTNQVDKLRQVSRDLRRKHKSLQNQHLPDGTDRIISGYLLENLLPEQKPEMRLVCEERSELTAIVESQQRDITALQQDSAQNKKCPSCGAASPDGIEDDDQSSKPTFSVRELRAILHERNELKLKLSRAEEQLNALQVDQQHDSGSDTSPSASTAAVDDEAPVQGPLPAEPDDAPWKRSSGIRKFFRKLFVESDIAVDLRQELQDLNLGTQEFDSWLGEKFDENDEFKNEAYYDSFTRDIPLQRSISLDRGIDIFSHFQRIGSEWSGSFHSVWTVGTEESEEGYGTLTERYRSFDDVPASLVTRSRRASTGGRDATSERNIALTVLKDSCKGIDTSKGTMSPQIRILSRCNTVSETFESINDSTNNKEIFERERHVVKSRKKLKVVIPKLQGITKSCPVSPNIQRLRNFSFRSSAEDFVSSYISDNDVDENLELSEPFCKSISVDQDYGDIKKQRRSGLLAIKREYSLRKGVLVKQEFQNCAKLGRRRGSLEYVRATSAGLKDKNSGKLQKDVTISSDGDLRIGPKIIICRAGSTINGSFAESKKHLTSNLVDISRNCDCRICTEGDKESYVQKAMNKFFVKVVSYRDYTRKLYWETNNWNENEMYNCFMHILKLLLGLWLRHHDHN
ncbi:unnamed protein product [Arctia plantaginis]|uniref:RH2 domain-containing protein n=1 Tax=Arctia plantaginis TaxID=874455 RepID=A0A8S0YRT6_ARCPL|nr:unnamed protein product [Arctia plantaginis]